MILFLGFCRAKPEVISLASRFQQVEKKSTVGLVEPPLKDNASQAKDAPSGFANFMKGFRNFHEVSLQFILQYWPSVKNATKNLLSRVGLDQVSTQSNTKGQENKGIDHHRKKMLIVKQVLFGSTLGNV